MIANHNNKQKHQGLKKIWSSSLFNNVIAQKTWLCLKYVEMKQLCSNKIVHMWIFWKYYAYNQNLGTKKWNIKGEKRVYNFKIVEMYAK